MRAGKRFAVVDTDDQNDLHARDVVEWWRREHVAPMLAVRDLVSEFAPQLELGDGLRIQAVSYRAKRFDTTIEKLTREPGKLAAMADIAGVRAVVNVQGDADAIAARIDDVVEVRRVRDWARDRGPRATARFICMFGTTHAWSRCSSERSDKTPGRTSCATAASQPYTPKPPPMTDRDHQFLIVYDRRDGSVAVDDLGHDVSAAMHLYGEREHELAGNADVEVVLVGSASMETLRRTHSSYFGGSDGLGSMLAAAGS